MKLTDAEIRAMKRFASSMADHIPPCPWNPFPRDSEWGRKIEAYWQRDQRAAARSAVMALVRKGFAEVSDAGSPMRYRITPIGRAALEKEKRA